MGPGCGVGLSVCGEKPHYDRPSSASARFAAAAAPAAAAACSKPSIVGSCSREMGRCSAADELGARAPAPAASCRRRRISACAAASCSCRLATCSRSAPNSAPPPASPPPPPPPPPPPLPCPPSLPPWRGGASCETLRSSRRSSFTSCVRRAASARGQAPVSGQREQSFPPFPSPSFACRCLPLPAVASLSPPPYASPLPLSRSHLDEGNILVHHARVVAAVQLHVLVQLAARRRRAARSRKGVSRA